MNNWQLCPKCNGTGTNYTYNSTSSSCVCDVCNGQKIISMFTGKPPQHTTIIPALPDLKPFDGDILDTKSKEATKKYQDFFKEVKDSDKAV